MNHPAAIRWLYRSLEFFFGVVAALLFLVLLRVLGGGELPGPPMGEVGAYMAGTAGALAFGLAWLSHRVASEPGRSAATAAPLSAVFFALAGVRYAAYFWGTELRAAAGPGLVVEFVLFSLIGAAVGTIRADAAPGLLAELGGGMARLPLRVKLWLAPLFAVVVAMPFLFLGHRAAQLLAGAQALNMLGLVLAGYHGWQRILGLSHLFAWTAALVVVGLEAASGEASGAYALWLWAAAALGGVSLAIDAVDVIRWFAGDRSDLTAPGGAGP